MGCATIRAAGLACLLAGFSPAAQGQSILREVYTNLIGSTLVSLTASTNYPYFPDLRSYPANFEMPVNFANNYGTRVRGYLLPPATGEYVFWIASDDQSELYLSGSDRPETRRLIAWVTGATSSREWTRQTNQQSISITLEGGRKYYIEALHKEGTGADHLSVGWRLPNGALERPIPGNRLEPWVLSTNAPTVTSQPADLTVSDQESAVFYTAASGAEPLSYCWHRDGLRLERETSALLILPSISLLDGGAAFQCVVANSLGSVTSRVARLSVYPETNPPVVLALNPPSGTTLRQFSQLEVMFSEPVQGVTADDLLINGQPATSLLGISPGPFLFQFPPPPPGEVSIAWAAGHDIRDFSLASNSFAGGSWTCTLDPSLPVPAVVINELLAANENGLRDEDGEPQDWIELLNCGAAGVNLDGWSLSDDRSNPSKWVFPARLLPPGGFLVVFASGKDHRPGGTNALHTNFKLSSTGESLTLFVPESPRLPASSLEGGFPEQRNDISYGLDPSDQWRYFATPSPGATNGQSTISGVVEPVHFSVRRGLFDRPFNLTLSTSSGGAQIRFTTNGSEPTLFNGVVYAGPLAVAATTVLRAAAFKDGCLPSPTATHTYFFGMGSALTSLPVLSLVTATNNLIGPTGIIGIGGGYYSNSVWYASSTNDYHNPRNHGIAWERPISAELIHPADNSGFQIDCGIRVHGADYIRPRYTPTSKYSFRLYFRGDYGPGKLDYPFFTNSPVTLFDQIVLRSGMNDRVNPFIRDELVRRLGNDTGRVDPIGTVMNLFINGEYKGYYNPTERVHNGFMQAHYGGSDDWDVITVGSKAQDGDTIAWNNLRSFVSTADVTSQGAYQEVERKLDLTSFVDYVLVYNASGCGDWPHNNWRAGRERVTNGIFRYFTWDAEWAWGFNNRQPSLNMFTNELNGTTELAGFFKRLKANPEFRLLFADRVHRHFFNGGALTDEHMLSRHNELSNMVRTVITGFNPVIATNWIPSRRPFLMAQMNEQGFLLSSNAPVFPQHGGPVVSGWQLVMSNQAGVIWFTTNGPDPRLRFSGAVDPAALLWSNGMTVRFYGPTLVRARSLQGTNWSALTEANFTVASLGLPLRITEIMYNPVGGDAFEFIELRNLGAAPVDVSGFRLSGVDFQFPTPFVIPAGATILLTSDFNPEWFAMRYPEATVHGRFSGSLANGGERLALLDRQDNVVTAVNYDDERGWPRLADGQGPSLQLLDPYGDPDQPANWQFSPQPGGSPGAPDAAPAMQAQVQLNEIAALNSASVPQGTNWPDWVELQNIGQTAADLSGWSLTDDSNPRKFVLPPETILQPGALLLVWCDSRTNMPGLHAGFALDADGESVFLFDAQTSRVDAVSFGRQLPDYTLGRLSSGWALTLPTPAQTNIAAPTASLTNLTINEWMGNPAAGEDDWLELFNPHPTLPVALRGLYLGNGETFEQIRAFSFVLPHGYFLLRLDQQPGPGSLEIKLPAAGSPILLCDELALEFERVSNPPQPEGVSRGRTPDASGVFAYFPGAATPGAANPNSVPGGIVLNEVLACNSGAVTNPLGRSPGFIEVKNTTPTNIPLARIGISIDDSLAPQWLFPSITLAPGAVLVVWCDPERPPSTNAETALNSALALPPRGGSVHLFTPAGRLLDSIAFGHQVPNHSIALYAGTWRLLSVPTPGSAAAFPATLGSTASLAINEWMAGSTQGPDWFELFNPSDYPVDLSGLYLTDDPSISGLTKFKVPNLSFVSSRGFVVFDADDEAARGGPHVNFKLDAEGESLLLLQQSLSLIDAVWFGVATPGISQGRLPDGSAQFVEFPGTPSPGLSNWRIVPDLLINEVLANTESPLEQAIELFNPGGSSLELGGWFLSNDRESLRKYQIPAGTRILPGQYAVLYEYQFGVGSNAFSLDPANGGELWISAAGVDGSLNGWRAMVLYPPSAGGLSLGRVPTSSGSDFVALAGRTFGMDTPTTLADFRSGQGLPNAAPLVGPVVISEIMYHGPVSADGTIAFEYIELFNRSGAPMPLFDPLNPGATWRFHNAFDFLFPSDMTLLPAEFVLVVNFDPQTQADKAIEFRTLFNLGPEVRLFGPFAGRLANEGDSVELYQPGVAIAGALQGLVTAPLLADRVHYGIAFPWPSYLLDGGGFSLQRRSPELYGNEGLNWAAAPPTPGRTNAVGLLRPPIITRQPASVQSWEGAEASFNPEVRGEAPIFYQWRLNRQPLKDQTNGVLIFTSVALTNSGSYDVVVANDGGVVLSEPAVLKVLALPRFTVSPADQLVGSNETAIITAAATGTEPLFYQWSFNGCPLDLATQPVLVISNVTYAHIGDYALTVSNEFGVTNAVASLNVRIKPIFLIQPEGLTALEGQSVTFRVAVTGAPPFGFRWRRNGATIVPYATGGPSLTLNNLHLTNAGTYTVVVSNIMTPGILSSNAILTVLVDADRDGTADSWELAYGFETNNAGDSLLDSDSDTFANAQEYLAGTNPLDPSDYLKFDLIEPGPAPGVVLQFLGVSNRNYNIESRDLGWSNPWSREVYFPARATNWLVRWTNSAAAPGAAYRVATPGSR